MRSSSQFALVLSYGGARASASAMGQQGCISSFRESARRIADREQAELDEVVSTSACSKLSSCPVFVGSGHGTDAPILVHDTVPSRLLEGGSDSEFRLGLDRLGEPLAMIVEPGRWNIQNRHLHAAGDVHSNCVGDDRVSVASTPPTGSPYPTLASGISAPPSKTGKFTANSICRKARASMSLSQSCQSAGGLSAR